ncbi:MAG: hypothetical protein KDK70_37790, partial [Myxococcales bacterium]|nr:hypothetical protein [Myxococcales bacterium]
MALLRSSVLVATTAGLGMTWACPAEACSPEPPQMDTEPCETLWFHVAGARMPANATASLRVRNDYVNEYGGHRGPDVDELDLPEPFVIERDVGSGFQPVEYTLVDEPDLVTGVRHVELADPQPGDYRVAWPSSTCGEPEVDTGAGALIAEWTLTPAVELPTALGRVTGSFSEFEQEFDLGIGGDCTPEVGYATIGRTELTLEISEAFAPWFDASTVGMVLDGEQDRGFAQVSPSTAEMGQWSAVLDILCSTDDPALLDRGWDPEGTHTVQFVAKVEG